MDREALLKEAERLHAETRRIDDERDNAPKKFVGDVVNEVATAWWRKNGDELLKQFGLK